jgi:p-hydroxybenzoate 3-monooxygenase
VRTQVVIIGAGPAGLLLAHLLRVANVGAVVLESRSREYVQGRVRAGVLEQTTVDLMRRLGVAERLSREGLVHDGTNLMFDGQSFHVDLAELTGGSTVTVYGQSEVIKDLNESADQRGIEIVYGAQEVLPQALDSERPFVTWAAGGNPQRADCDFVIGCDGFHGVSRTRIPPQAMRAVERVYPFGWLGILAEVPPCDEELIYANHERGFALASMRSLTRSRYYLQCSLEESVDDWSDERFWDELSIRLGPQTAAHITRGKSFEKSIAPLRSFVCEPLRWNRLFLAGDAAHIVPPTGAKGLNLAAADVVLLSQGLASFYASGSSAGIDAYSDRALDRIWKAERFSWWLTKLTHRFPEMDTFDRQLQLAEFKYLRGSKAAKTVFAENYVGLPLENLAIAG